MPRYEKLGKSKQQFFEILLVGERLVITAEGSRASADVPWDVDHRSPQKNLGGRAFYDKKIASLLSKKYALVGDKLEVIKPPPPKSAEDIELAKRKVEYVALLRTSGVTWTGKTPETAGQLIEVKIEGSRLFIRQAKTGQPDETTRTNYGLEDLALEHGATRLHAAAKSGFGP
jgi:hypothetical protein